MAGTPGSAMANFAALSFANSGGIPLMVGPHPLVLQNAGVNNPPMFNMPHMAALTASQAAAISRASALSQQPSPAQLQLMSIQQAAQQRIQAQLAQQAQQVMQAQARAMGVQLPQSDNVLSQFNAIQPPLPRMSLSADGANLGAVAPEALTVQQSSQNPAMLDLSSAAAIEQANIASLPELQGANDAPTVAAPGQ